MIDAKFARMIADISKSSNQLTGEFIIRELASIEQAVCEGKSHIDARVGAGQNREVISHVFQKLGYFVRWTPADINGWFIAHISW